MDTKTRDGFTLLELLIVIAIIGVLVALTAGAVFQVQDNQRVNVTESTMRAAMKVLDQQWRAVLDDAEKEDIPAAVIALGVDKGGNDAGQRRARLIYKLMRLAQEFPMSINEAKNGVAGFLPAKSVYSTPLAALGPAAPEVENSTVFLLAIQQNRHGAVLSPDNVPGSLSDTNKDGLNELVDAYGNPMVFFRFPTGSPELDSRNPAQPNSGGAKFRNPLDPQGLLLDPNWNFAGNPSVATFQTATGMLVQDPSTSQPIARYMVPTLVSMGKNGKLGLNNDMSVTSGKDNDANDNIYSFRLGLDKRGN